MQAFAQEDLFFMGEDGRRAPFGSIIGCNPPWTAPAVACFASLNDPGFRTVERVQVECSSASLCSPGHAADCCKVTDRDAISPPLVEEPSPAEAAAYEDERCGRLRRRRDACRPYCTSPSWSSQCADYWDRVDPGCR